MLRKQQKHFEQGGGEILENAAVGNVQKPFAYDKTLVHGLRLLSVEFVQQILLQRLQQHFVQSLQAHHRAIVALHKLLYRHVVGIVEITEGVREVA